MNPLSEPTAHAIWDVLTAHAGADEFGRDNFVDAQTHDIRTEFRFCGDLGVGGKFRRGRVWIGPNCVERWSVDCYREDLTDGRRNIIEMTNEALAELQKNGVPG